MNDVDPKRLPLFESAAFLLGQLGSHSSYRFDQLLTPLGIKPPQYGTLRLLEANDGRTQQQLCEALGIHRNVMVSLIDALEKRGLVERRRHPVDRRAHAVHLLPAGREMIARAGEIADGLNAELLAPLDPEDRPRVLAMLQRMAVGAGMTPGVHPGLTVEPGTMPMYDPHHI
ncbi:MarR family winged helix-turn-helix transcriptional regulator [Nocardia sp. CDC160]|uniref:MarR family winged helix-turn-helix transcriptional regulator n=1 Tax=Nocardia sp. CDC160 TaxID=3112166 RepID=UPI002DBD0EE5|nr:MarR family winged helix-turn-helix transcriptional regulator [Nocardia sp. CDC160]MEC3920516.1 MarR family winged helix-turn-helix transcriptional regulator [Nocardia sp. CDC160]